PRRYGWHGTLVAPFTLADGVTASDLAEEARSWAGSQRRFALDVEAMVLDQFIALRPARGVGEAQLREMAADALRRFAPLRAPLSPQDLDRRLRAPLTDRQRALLAVWHYPFVLDEFRFHMTLTDTLDDERLHPPVVAWWRDQIGRMGP